jgi:hypothetical protein
MQQVEIFRINITYTKKFDYNSGGCIFMNALSKEDATKAAEKILIAQLIEEGFPKDCFKLEVRKSSMSEVEFYKQNRYNKSYSTMVN